MDGLEATKLIRRAGFTTQIIALTANAMGHHQTLCREAGMNFFLAKPFTRVDVLRAIAACVSASPASANSNSISIAPAPDAPVPHSNPVASN